MLRAGREFVSGSREELIKTFEYLFWVLAVVLQVAAGTSFFRQKLYRKFPAFFCYTIFEVSRSLGLFGILQIKGHTAAAYSLYFHVYWWTDAASAALCLVVIHEAAREFFYEYRIARVAVSFAMGVGAVALLGACIVLTRGAPGTEMRHLIGAILLLDRSIGFVETGLVAILFVCAMVLGFHWRRELSFGISLGLGILGAMDLMAASARVHFGRIANSMYGVSKMFAYALAVVVWVVYIALSSKRRDSVECLPEVGDAELWNASLGEVLKG